MRRLKRDVWNVGIAVVGMQLLLVLMVWVPVSAAGAYEGTSGLATLVTGTVQASPTVDVTATMTTLQEEKLKLDIVQQRQAIVQQEHTWENGLWSNAATVSSIFLVVLGALIGLSRWLADRHSEREKRAEERFQAVITGLGNKDIEARLGVAIMLRTFLLPKYKQFYRQVFDLTVAYLQSREADGATTDFIRPSQLRGALIFVFKKSFKNVRGKRWKEQEPRSLGSDSSDYDRLGDVGLQLDEAYLVKADLRGVWMREASLQKAHLFRTKFTGAHLKGADFTDAYLEKAQLRKTDSSKSKLCTGKTDESGLYRGRYLKSGLHGSGSHWGKSRSC